MNCSLLQMKVQREANHQLQLNYTVIGYAGRLPSDVQGIKTHVFNYIYYISE